MKKKNLYRMYNIENDKTIGWFNDSEDMFYLMEWYEGSEFDVGYEKYELVDVVE